MELKMEEKTNLEKIKEQIAGAAEVALDSKLVETVDVITAIYNKWVLTPQKEIEYLKSELILACRYLSEAKKKWASGTTNSDVDMFIEKWVKR